METFLTLHNLISLVMFAVILLIVGIAMHAIRRKD
jgi:hypothetical protein